MSVDVLHKRFLASWLICNPSPWSDRSNNMLLRVQTPLYTHREQQNIKGNLSVHTLTVHIRTTTTITGTSQTASHVTQPPDTQPTANSH